MQESPKHLDFGQRSIESEVLEGPCENQKAFLPIDTVALGIPSATAQS